MLTHKKTGLFLAFGSALAFSLGNVGVRLVVGNLSIWGLVFLRGLLGTIIMVVVARVMKKSLWNRPGLLLGIGLCGFLSTICTFTAISRIPLYQAMVLLYLYPVISIVLSFVINGERISHYNIFMAILALIGCLVLIWPDEQAGLNFELAHVIGALGSVFYSLALVLTRRLGASNSGGLEPLFFYSLCCLLGAAPLAALFGSGLGLESVQVIASGLLVGAVVSSGQLLGYAAIRWLPAYQVGVIGTLEVVCGALSSWLIFGDPMTLRALSGGLLVVLVALGLGQDRKPLVSIS